MAKGNGHCIDLTPPRWEMRFCHLRDLDLRSFQQTEPAEKLLLFLSSNGGSHPGRTDIRGVHQDFRDAQHPMLAMIVRDRKASDPDRMARVIGAGGGRGARVECHCYGEDLEDRT